MMDHGQLALAVVNDPGTIDARAAARAAFISGSSWESAVHQLLPLVIAEVKKPIYEGIAVYDWLWGAAAEVLQWELDRYQESLVD